MSAMPGMIEPSLSTSDWQRCCTLKMVMVIKMVMMVMMVVTVVIVMMLVMVVMVWMMINLRMQSEVEQSPSQGG